MIERLAEAFRVLCGLGLSKMLARLFCDLVEKLDASDAFHDNIDVFYVVVRLMVAYNVRMIKLLKARDFLFDVRKIVLKLTLVYTFDGDHKIGVMLACNLEDFSKSAFAKHNLLTINQKAMFKFSDTLLTIALTVSQTHSLLLS